VQSACSSSLLAVVQACNALNAGDCAVAVAGGVSVNFPEVSGYIYEEGNIFSKDGHCRVFDAQATGIIRGNGAGVVVLKRLGDAIRDKDNIHSVIRGWASNNDGSNKAGFTAPSASSQATVMLEALRRSNLEPETIGYVEAHGTATKVGDSIEAQSLKTVFNQSSSRPPLAIGSVKSNFGHLDVACGIAGLLKAILAIENKQLPASLHFHTPNPEADFSGTPLYVNTSLKDWDLPPSQHVRRAAVNSFGIGGTNVHVIVEEYQEEKRNTTPRQIDQQQMVGGGNHLLVFSAKSDSALQATCLNFLQFLSDNPNCNMGDVAYTLQTARKDFQYRASVVVQSQETAHEQLTKLCNHVLMSAYKAPKLDPPVILLFPGQNTEFYGMALSLYRSFPLFRTEMDMCIKLLPSHTLRTDVAHALLAEQENVENRIPTNIAQPALFIFQYCCAKQLIRLGVNPLAMIGHSLGEYTAACIAGVFKIEEAVKLVVARGEILHSVYGTGTMLVVNSDAESLAGLITNSVCVAAINAPQQTVLSGPREALEKIQHQLAQKGVKSKAMGNYPFHHAKLSTKPLLDELERMTLSPPTLPYLSNLHGGLITPEQATSSQYWADHMTHCVRFMDNVNKANSIEAGDTPVWLEVGPGTVLSALVSSNLSAPPTVISCLPNQPSSLSKERDVQGSSLLEAIGFLWRRGVHIDWSSFNSQGQEARKSTLMQRVVELPTYPFQCVDFRANPTNEARPPSSVYPPVMLHDGKQGASVLSDESSVQGLIASLWDEVIGTTGSNGESWFEVGGDSLNCVQLLARFSTTFGVSLSVQDIFSHPTVASQCELLKKQGLAIQHSEPMEGQGERKLLHEYAASMQQESLYFNEMLHPKGPEYLIHFSAELQGDLNKDVLEQAFQAIINAHAHALRVFFVMQNEQLMVHIKQDATFHFYAYQDWTNQPDKLKQYLQDEAVRGFDVHDPSEPLMRVYLLKTSPSTHTLFVVVHHLIVDGWSLGIIMRDLRQAYQSILKTGDALLPVPKATYAKFAEWQRDRFRKSSSVRQNLATFWKEQLEDAKPLPLGDFPRSKTPSSRGGRVPVHLSPEVVEGLHSVARAYKTTLFATVMAAFQILLHTYTGQDDISVGTACANRLRSEWEELVGLFTNMVVIRTPHLDPTQPFSAFLSSLAQTILRAVSSQEMPFHVVVDEVRPTRDPAIHPLFQVALILHSELSSSRPQRELQQGTSPDTTVVIEPRSSWETQTHTTRFDLNLQLWPEKDKSYSGYMEYATEIFLEDTIKRMVDNLTTIINSVVADSAQKISNISCLSPAERDLVVHQFNATDAPFPDDTCLHTLLSTRASQHPDRVALVWEPDRSSWSYKMVEDCANKLAAHLIKLGIRPSARIGMVFDRTPFIVASILGVWKAGAAYVPINPEAPKRQFDHVLKDASIECLLVQSSTEPYVRSLLDEKLVRVVNVDLVLTEEQHVSPPSVPCSPSQLAYIIYTSGSTGTPKGVCIEHRGLCNLVHDLAHKSWGVFPTDRLLQMAKYHFDFSVSEIFVPLYAGATLYISEVQLLPGPQFVDLLQQLEITVMKLLPSVLNLLADVPDVCSRLSKLRLIISAGEQLPFSTLKTFVSSTRTVVNSYGPTECTVSNNAWRVELADLERMGSKIALPHVGRPISNSKCFILHPASLQILPIGAVGELFIGGIGLAKGYTNIETTASRFLKISSIPELASGFSSSAEARLYRTGDLARWLSDGSIQILGRVDTQIKLRGYRIELEGIKAILCAHPLVRNACVIVHSPVPNDPSADQLVAFVERNEAHRDGSHYPDDEVVLLLKSHVANILPAYMHPYLYIIGPLPRGPSGKIDAKGLSNAVLISGRSTAAKVTPPANQIEADLLALICSVLNLGRSANVGVDENFFELGGNSLLAARFLTRLNEKYKCSLRMNSMFSLPTVRKLAHAVSPQPQIAPPVSLNKSLLVLHEGEKGKTPIFCVHPAGGNAMCFYPLATAMASSGHPIYALEDPSQGKDDYLFPTISDMAKGILNNQNMYFCG
jgi:amino acid adenylation domain-containing protein